MLVCFLFCCFLSLHTLLHKPSAIQVLCDFTSRALSGCLHQLKICRRKTALIGSEGEAKQEGSHASPHFRGKCLRMIKNCIPPSFSLAKVFSVTSPHSLFLTLCLLCNKNTWMLGLLSKLFKWTDVQISTKKVSCETTSLSSPGAIPLRFQSTCPAKVASRNISHCPVNIPEPWICTY